MHNMYMCYGGLGLFKTKNQRKYTRSKGRIFLMGIWAQL